MGAAKVETEKEKEETPRTCAETTATTKEIQQTRTVVVVSWPSSPLHPTANQTHTPANTHKHSRQIGAEKKSATCGN